MSYKGFYFYGIEEWSQFFSRCNWYTFHPFMFEIEDERSMGGLEVTIIIMGLGFRVRWNYSQTEMVDDIIQKVSEIRKGGDA